MSTKPPAANPTAPAAGRAPLFKTRLGLLLSYLVTIIVYCGVGRRNQSTTDYHYTPFTPALWVVAIWGVIFILQAVGVVWAAVPRGYGRDAGLKERTVSAVAVPWMLTWGFQILRELSFLTRTGVGLVIGLLFLVAAFSTMAWANLRLKNGGVAPVPRSWHGALTHWGFFVPSSMYAATLTASIVLGTLIVADKYGADDADVTRWVGVGLVPLITLLAVAVAALKADVAWPAALAWAMLTIFVAHKVDKPVAGTSMACLVVNALAALYAAFLVWRGRAGARAGGPAGGAVPSVVAV